jgi:hypothetical protein
VSPPWSSWLADRLRVFVHPQHLVLLRIKRGLKPLAVDRQLIPLAVAEGEAPWEPALSSLRTALEKPGWQGLVPTVVLANHFVRYAVIPWNDELAGRDEQQAYLRHCFELAYGEASRQWDLRMSAGGVGKPALASAIPQALLAGLEAELERAGMRCRAIYPHLMLTANQAISQVREGSFCLVAIERGRACLALIEHGAWRAVRNLPMAQEELAHLPALIRRESIIHGLDTGHWQVVCHWPESDHGEGPVIGTQPVRTIACKPWTGDFDDHAYRLAMWHE